MIVTTYPCCVGKKPIKRLFESLRIDMENKIGMLPTITCGGMLHHNASLSKQDN